MTPREALVNLDAAAARAPLTRADHVILQQSTQLLAALIEADEKRRTTDAEASKP